MTRGPFLFNARALRNTRNIQILRVRVGYFTRWEYFQIIFMPRATEHVKMKTKASWGRLITCITIISSSPWEVLYSKYWVLDNILYYGSEQLCYSELICEIVFTACIISIICLFDNMVNYFKYAFSVQFIPLILCNVHLSFCPMYTSILCNVHPTFCTMYTSHSV